MKLLRGLLGDRASIAQDRAVDRPEMVAAELEASEREHELEVLRAEHGRLDEFRQRQLRYQRYAWQPPAQGGAPTTMRSRRRPSAADADGDQGREAGRRGDSLALRGTEPQAS